MGEFSKRLGDVGENVIVDFLKSIGWFDPQRNIDIDSVDKEHRKTSNGLDGLFHYNNPMINNTIEFVHYSSKYSSKPYATSSLIADFKKHYTDLVKTIESYKKSEQHQDVQLNYENIDSFFYRGLLFWLNNSESENDDLIVKLSKIEINTGVPHDGVFLVDNKRFLFIADAINYTKIQFNSKGFDVEFIYFLTGLNSGESLRSGKILPIEYINASILPMIVRKEKETAIIIFSIDNFNKEDLLKLFGIANTIGCNVQGATRICFPDYKESEHLPIVENAKQNFADSDFTKNLTIDKFPVNPLK